MPPGTHQAQHRRFAHVDVPAEQGDRPERGLDLRPVAKGQAATAKVRRRPPAPRSGRAAFPRALRRRACRRSRSTGRRSPACPASAPGPKMPTKSSAHTSEFTERDDTRISFANRLSGVNGQRLCAARMPTGNARTNASERAERRDVDRFHQRRVDAGRDSSEDPRATCARTDRAIWSGASARNSGMTSTVCIDTTIATTIARYTAKRVSRCAGVNRRQTR